MPSSDKSDDSEGQPPAEIPTSLPAPKDVEQLRLATAAMVERNLTLGEAVKEFSVESETLRLWHRAYAKIAEAEASSIEGTPLIPKRQRPRIAIDRETGRKFDKNWAEMMRVAELERPQPSPLHQRLMSFPLTRWMFRGEQIDKITVAGAAAALALSALAIKAALSDRDSTSEPTKPPVDLSAPIDIKDPDTFSGSGQKPTLTKVAKALEDFAQLETWQQRLPYVRNADKVEPLMKSYYETHPDGRLPDLEIDPLASFLEHPKGLFAVIQATVGRVENQPIRESQRWQILAELRDQQPNVLFDWEVLVNYEASPWPEFRSSKSSSPARFRVQVSPGDYYNKPFMEEEVYASYAIRLSRGRGRVFGFVERGTELHKKIKSLLLNKEGSEKAMILELAFPEEGYFDDIVEIRAVIAEGWIKD